MIVACAFIISMGRASAGPPYITDDPEPTPLGQLEIYLYDAGTHTIDDTSGASGLDVNYGAGKNLQLSMTLPIAYDHSHGAAPVTGFGNVELAAKYRLLHQDDIGADVAVFPRVFLPSASSRVGDQHASFFLPVWLEKDMGQWSVFGGGGCEINRGDGSKDFCLTGLAVTGQFRTDLQIGLEVYHQTPDTIGGRQTTALDFGARYDLNETFHLVGSIGLGLQNAARTNRYAWYAALLYTH